MNDLLCCFFVQQRTRSDHHGHDWQDPAVAQAENKSVREIARITGLSRNTIAKWLAAEVDGPPKYRRGEQPGKLTAFHDVLRQALKADARRPRHERRTARALYTEIKAAGYEGGYSSPRWAASRGGASTTK